MGERRPIVLDYQPREDALPYARPCEVMCGVLLAAFSVMFLWIGALATAQGVSGASAHAFRHGRWREWLLEVTVGIACVVMGAYQGWAAVECFRRPRRGE